MNLEDFKQVEGFPDYLISEYGVVWDTRQNKELKWIKNNDFNCVNMYNIGGKKELVKIHQLVAKTYLVKPENATKIVVHKDLDRGNNHYSNLEWQIKGVSNKAILRWSNYHGVKYHLTELEEISEKASVSVSVVRNRLEAGWSVDETIQGYKNSDVHWVDGIKFIGELAVRKYNLQKKRDARAKQLREKREYEERCRLEEEERQRTILEKRGTDDLELVKEARKAWKGMMSRCYDSNRPDYPRYGARGVSVCSEWKDQDVFCGWYIKNKIDGWDLEKDILQIGVPTRDKIYSPNTCCFVPRYLNQWFAKTSLPQIRQNSVGKYITLSVLSGINKIRKQLSSNTDEDLMEQWYLYKDLHLSRRVWELKRDYRNLKAANPKSPEIHPTLISVLENFSTEEYLRTRNI